MGRLQKQRKTDPAEGNQSNLGDYEDIDIYDWFAHNFVYESDLEA